MSKFASKFQKVLMSFSYRGKEIFKPLNTGRIDERVSAVREWVANVFFYTKNGKTIMIDAGYNYERLAEKMKWLELEPASIQHILLTHLVRIMWGRWKGIVQGFFGMPSSTLEKRKINI